METNFKISAKRKKFCEEYLIDLNATQAAIRAGYSKKSATVIAAELLTFPNVQQYLTLIRQESAQKLEITRERVLKEYAKIAFFDVRKIFDENNGLLDIKQLDDDSAGAIAGIESLEQFQMVRGSTVKVGDLKKVKLNDKRAALDSICRVLGYNSPEQIDLKTISETDVPSLKIRTRGKGN